MGDDKDSHNDENQPVQTEPPKPSEPEQFVENRFGERILHIYLEESTGLTMGDDDQILDPIIEITAFGEKKYSRILKDISKVTTAYWGEHFFFEKDFKTKYEIDNSLIEIKVFDHNTIGPNREVGYFTISPEMIYSHDDHAMKYRYFPLQNLEKDCTKLFGFLKLSVHVARPGDLRVKLEDEPKLEKYSEGSDKGMSSIMLPPQIKVKKQQIEIILGKAERVAKMDYKVVGTGTADPFVEFSFGGLQVKSRTVKDSLEPVWNQKICIPTVVPTINDRLTVALKDKDTMSSETIGTFSISLEDITKGKYKVPTWINVYGAWADADDKEQKKLMNNVSSLGSKFKGRVLLQINVADTSSPLFGTYSLKSGEELKAPDEMSMELWADISYVSNLLSDTTEHQVMIGWGGKFVETQPKTYKRGVILLFERLKLQEEFSINDLKDLPDIIISVYHIEKKAHISYLRIPAKEALDFTAKSKLLFLQPDKAINKKMREDCAGCIKIRCAIAPSASWENIESTSNWNEPPVIDKNVFKMVYIYANVFQAKKLLSGDEDGLSDPFVHINHFGTTQRTPAFPRTLNPAWNSRLLIASWIVNGELPPMIMKVFDQDRKFSGGFSYDYLGSCVINLGEEHFQTDPMFVASPKWYDLRQDKNNVMGKVLASFSVLDESTEFPPSIPRTLSVKRVPHYCKIKILGLRNLQSLGVLPIRRAFVKISLNSLKSIGQASAEVRLSDIVTEPKESGSSPNIGTVLTLESMINSDVKLMPVLTCNVLDSGILGFGKNKSIGAFEIDLGYFSLLYKSKLVLKLKKAQRILTKKNSMRCLEKVTALIDKFLQDIQQSKEIVNLEENLEEADLGDDEEVMELLPTSSMPREAVVEGEPPADEEVIGEEDEKIDVGLFEALTKKEFLATNIEPKEGEEAVDVSKLVAPDLSNILNNQHEAFNNLIDRLYQDSTKPEEDVSFEFEEENKELYIRTEKTSINVQEAIDSSAISRIPLLLDETINDEKEVIEHFRALPKNVKTQNSKNFVMKPKYKKIKMGNTEHIVNLEIEKPDPEQFMALGYDNKQVKHKHYRYCLGKELEKTGYMGARQFQSIPISRGKQVTGSQSFFRRLVSGPEEPSYKEVGQFKGTVDIISEEDLQAIEALGLKNEGIDIHVPTQVDSWRQVTPLELEIMKKNSVLVRVYVIEADIYRNYDITSATDPYLKLKLGNQEIIDETVIEDNNHPQFCKMFEFKTTFPGDSNLSIEIWDKDIIKKDELVGLTSIDIENRFYDNRWRDLEHIPIETRTLTHPNSKEEKGTVKTWVEIFQAQDPLSQKMDALQGGEKAQEKVDKVWDISPRPPQEMEVRVVVWEANDVPIMDVEDTTDIYVTCGMPFLREDPVELKTDVHYRSQTGFGSFNWRLVFPVVIDEYTKEEELKLVFKIWDKDILKSNEYISEATVPISKIIFQAIESGCPVRVSFL